MKATNKLVLTTICIIFLSSTSFSQIHLPDSIHIRIDNKIEINISTYGYENISETIQKDLISFQSIISTNSELKNYNSSYIKFIPGKSFTINKSEPEEIIVLKGDLQTSYKFKIKCEISSENYFMTIRFNEYDDLSEESLVSQIKQAIDSSAAVNARYAGIYEYNFTDQKLVDYNANRSEFGQSDVLLLKGGIGAGLIKNQPVTDISAVIALSFSKKGILRNEFYISDNLIFNFDANQNLYTNNFLNLGYRYNISRNITSPNWIGVEAGYLITRNGDFFDSNTFRLGFNWELGKSVSVAPQIYFSGNLSKMYPGLRIGFGF